MATRTYHARLPVMLDLEVLSGLEPAAIEDAIKKRFAGMADPLSGTQVFFGSDHTAGHMMARTRNATLIADGDVKITLENQQR